jgi:hypothetical protein
MLLKDADWPQINGLRARIEQYVPTSVAHAAQYFSSAFAETFSSIALARVFLVTPFADLPSPDQSFARKLTSDDARLTPRTPTLSLLGTYGREEDWKQRERSAGHLAIPLLDKAFVSEVPMIAKLLGDLNLDLASLDDDFAAVTSRMLGAQDGKFYVANADTDLDSRGRHIIPNRDFVKRHEIRTVFGMGGSYYDGALAVAIFFTQERLERLVTDRFASFISTFKVVTTRLQQKKALYRP